MEKPNLEYLDALAGTDQAFRDRIIDILKSELHTERSAYQRALADENWYGARGFAHKLKHKIGILGMQEGHRLAARHEEALRQEDVSLSADFEAILEQLETFLQTL